MGIGAKAPATGLFFAFATLSAFAAFAAFIAFAFTAASRVSIA